MDGKHVVFGTVLENMELVRTIERFGSNSGAPKAYVLLLSVEFVVVLSLLTVVNLLWTKHEMMNILLCLLFIKKKTRAHAWQG